MMRPLRQGRRAAPAALPRIRLQDQSVADDADLAVFALDLDRVRALVGGPSQKDVARARGRIQVKRGRVLQWLLVEAARFKPRGGANGDAGPTHNAVKRVPAMIEQDAAARHRRIDAPVCDPLNAHCDRGLGPKRPPADGSHGADRALVNQGRDLAADRRLEPIMHGMQDSPGARSGGRYPLWIL